MSETVTACFWMDDTGVLRQWIAHPQWQSAQVPHLRRQIDGFNSDRRIRRWIAFATREGMDPL